MSKIQLNSIHNAHMYATHSLMQFFGKRHHLILTRLCRCSSSWCWRCQPIWSCHIIILLICTGLPCGFRLCKKSLSSKVWRFAIHRTKITLHKTSTKLFDCNGSCSLIFMSSDVHGCCAYVHMRRMEINQPTPKQVKRTIFARIFQLQSNSEHNVIEINSWSKPVIKNRIM